MGSWRYTCGRPRQSDGKPCQAHPAARLGGPCAAHGGRLPKKDSARAKRDPLLAAELQAMEAMRRAQR